MTIHPRELSIARRGGCRCGDELLPDYGIAAALPGIDGGPILKWSLVERGYTPEAADETVKGVNWVMSVGLGFAAGVEIQRRRWFLGSILALFVALAQALGFGLVEE